MAVLSIVTQTSDPTLWNSLYKDYQSWNYPGWVCQVSKTFYKVVHKADGSIEFHQHDSYEYIDSRSTINSRKTSYNELKEDNP